MEELLQIILQWSPCQQQLMIYLVAIEDPEKLENGARQKKGPISGKQLALGSPCLQLLLPLGSEALRPLVLPHFQAGLRTGASRSPEPQVSEALVPHSPWTGCS